MEMVLTMQTGVAFVAAARSNLAFASGDPQRAAV